MSTFEFASYAQYDVRLTARQALRALLGRRIRLPRSQVQPLVAFGVGTSRVNVECWGMGGSGATDDGGEASGSNGRPHPFLGGGGGAGGHTSLDGDEVHVWAGGGVGGTVAGCAGGGSSAYPHLGVTAGGSISRTVGGGEYASEPDA